VHYTNNQPNRRNADLGQTKAERCENVKRRRLMRYFITGGIGTVFVAFVIIASGGSALAQNDDASHTKVTKTYASFLQGSVKQGATAGKKKDLISDAANAPVIGPLKTAFDRISGRTMTKDQTLKTIAGLSKRIGHTRKRARLRSKHRVQKRALPGRKTNSGGAKPTPKPHWPVPAHLRPRLAKIAKCESGGSPTVISSNGLYHGKYQFLPSTWKSVGGTGLPSRASEAEQDHRAALLLQRSGRSPWPVCGS
jgi:hypothetical protein